MRVYPILSSRVTLVRDAARQTFGQSPGVTRRLCRKNKRRRGNTSRKWEMKPYATGR